MGHHAQQIFVFLVETGFHHIGQSGLELLTSGDPPILASQSAGITEVSHRTQPMLYLNEWYVCLNNSLLYCGIWILAALEDDYIVYVILWTS